MDVVVNAAMSVDGKLSTRAREQVAISGPADFERVDQLRADSDAVMVGVGTVLADDPHLDLDDTALKQQRQQHAKPANPARVIADSRGRTPLDARILDDVAKTIVLAAKTIPESRQQQLESAGAEVLITGEQRVEPTIAIEKLEKQGIKTLMVEGGGELIFSLFEAGVVDELSVFIGPMVIGGRDAPTLADGEGFLEEFPELELQDTQQVDAGLLCRWTVQ